MGSYHTAASRQAPPLARTSTATRHRPIAAVQGDTLPTLFPQLRVSARTTFAGFTRILKQHLGAHYDDRWIAYLNNDLEAADMAK